jgi:hypothetical protein
MLIFNSDELFHSLACLRKINTDRKDYLKIFIKNLVHIKQIILFI